MTDNPVGEDAYDIVVVSLVSLLSTVLFFAKFNFYVQAIVDLERKAYMMNQCGFMISPMKIKKYDYSKVFPTCNILDRVSLNAWFQLRRISIDYGRKYFYRHELFLPVSFLISVACILLYSILLYLRQKADMFEEHYQNIYRLYWLLGRDFLVFGLMGFHFMYKAGSINSEFRDHIHILKNNKAVLLDLLECRDYYFGDFLQRPDILYDMDLSKLASKASESFLHEKLKEEVVKMLGDNIDRDLESFLRSMVVTYEGLICKLVDEEEINSLMVLGMAVSRTSVLNLFVAVVSVILTAWQLF